MAVGISVEFAGVTQAQFDAANAQVDLENDPPPGLIFHASGPVDGGWRVIDVWESRASFDAFSPVIQQSAQAAGIEFQAPPDIEEFPVHEFYSGSN